MKNKKVFDKIAIIGYGRFGCLLEKMLSPYGEVFLITSNKNVKNKILISDLGDIDLVIPAVPISVLERVLIKINPYLKPGSLIMDVCSVKLKPCQWLKKNIGNKVEILGTHPMFGPDSAKYGFKGLQVVLCPIRVSNKKLKLIRDIFLDLELKIIEATPRMHDMEAAKSLALVHFIGRSLSEAKVAEQSISSVGFERLLTVNETVCNDTWQLFIDMNKYNPYARKIRDKYIKSINKLNTKIIKEEV